MYGAPHAIEIRRHVTTGFTTSATIELIGSPGFKWSFSVPTSIKLKPGDWITVTASVGIDTSEFTEDIQVH